MKKTLLFAAVFMMMQFHLMAQQGGYALLFDGTEDYVQTSSAINIGNVYTIEFWMKPYAIPANPSQADPLSMGTGNFYLAFSITHEGKMAFGTGDGSAWSGQVISGTGIISANRWYHVAGTSDGSKIQMYVDGKYIGQATTSNSTNQILNIGFRNGVGFYFDGLIDEVRVWDHARTEAQIKANMYKELSTVTNLKAYYKMSNGTGTSLTDNSGNSNTGTLTNGPAWKVSGCFAGSRQALDFDGTASTGGEYVGITNGSALIANQNNITIELWVYPIKTGPWSSWTTDYEGLVNFGTSNDFYFVRWDTYVELRYNSTTYNVNTVRSPIEINKWQHLAFVKNGSSLKLYRNGILEDESTLSGGNYTNTTNLMTIGKSFYSSYHWPFKGSIDEFRIWTTARTESQVRETMFKTLEGNESGLNTYFRFDQIDGNTIVYDISSNAHNGTLTNMETTDWVASTAFNTWLGGESTDWSTTANWSNGVPASAQSVGIYNWSSSLPNITTYLPVLPTTVSVNSLLIPSGVSTAGNVNLTATGSVFMGSSMTLSSSALNTAGNLMIESGKVLTLPATSQLTVSGATTNSAGNSGLVIQSGSSGTGSLIHNSSGVAATVQTYITGSSTITNKKYHFVSIPTQYASPTSNLFLGSYLYKLDPTQTFADNNYGKWVSLGTSTTTELQTSQGYMIYYPNTSNTYTFEGNLNNGTYAYSLTGHSGSGVYTFNLVPNPYPSSLVWNTGDATKWTKSAGVGGSCYIWNAGNGNYSTVSSSATSYIPVGQAFLVLVTNEAAPTLSALNAARTHSSQAFYKSGTGDENQLVVEAFSNNYADKTVIEFSAEATETFDLQTDGLKLSGLDEAPQLYTLSGNEKYSINNLPVFEGQKIVPMNFETQFTGEVTLNFSGIESFETSLNMYLQDLVTNQTLNLRNQQVYTFSHNPANPVNRFNLVFGGTIGIEESISKPAVMWIAGNTLYINTPEKAGQSALLEVFDVSGKILTSRTVTLSELTTLELKQQGLIIVKLTTGDEVLTTKGILMK